MTSASRAPWSAPRSWPARSLRVCVAHGGSITGEHGVGADKKAYMPVMFTDADLATQQLVRCALDPDHLCNPAKVYPTPRLCGETPAPTTPTRWSWRAWRSASEAAPVTPTLTSDPPTAYA